MAGAPIYVSILTLGVFVFWVLSVYILLSMRGVRRDQMGRLGQMANGVAVVASGVGLISEGVGIICCGEEVCRPPYEVSYPYYLKIF